MIKDILSSAAALYDGGWRSEDREELIQEYNLTEEEVNILCDALLDITLT